MSAVTELENYIDTIYSACPGIDPQQAERNSSFIKTQVPGILRFAEGDVSTAKVATLLLAAPVEFRFPREVRDCILRNQTITDKPLALPSAVTDAAFTCRSYHGKIVQDAIRASGSGKGILPEEIAFLRGSRESDDPAEYTPDPEFVRQLEQDLRQLETVGAVQVENGQIYPNPIVASLYNQGMGLVPIPDVQLTEARQDPLQQSADYEKKARERLTELLERFGAHQQVR